RRRGHIPTGWASDMCASHQKSVLSDQCQDPLASERRTVCHGFGVRQSAMIAPHVAPPARPRYRNDVTAGPAVRPEDVPLHDDVRWLAASLGKVILRLEGEEAFESVESLRQACRARRYAMPDAPTLDALLEQVSALPIERTAIVARAFTLFFLLINTAEQVHRVRRARAYRSTEIDAPQPGGARWAMRTLRSEGHDAAAVERAMLSLDVRPVLTAHPTE